MLFRSNPDARILRLEGAIAEESWFDDEVTPAAFKAELASGSGPITVWINSPGGDCVAAAQIYNMLCSWSTDEGRAKRVLKRRGQRKALRRRETPAAKQTVRRRM